jgi:membrane-associated phospholipid phosphatase
MALLSFALTDSFILAWAAKERFSVWRPITAIREGGFGVVADPRWEPLVGTPPHPEFPSGHAADCSTGAHVLRQLFAPETPPVRYVATDEDGQPTRDFPTFAAIASECAASRLWAGVHFRTANDAGLVLGAAIAERVVGTMLLPLSRP